MLLHLNEKSSLFPPKMSAFRPGLVPFLGPFAPGSIPLLRSVLMPPQIPIGFLFSLPSLGHHTHPRGCQWREETGQDAALRVALLRSPSQLTFRLGSAPGRARQKLGGGRRGTLGRGPPGSRSVEVSGRACAAPGAPHPAGEPAAAPPLPGTSSPRLWSYQLLWFPLQQSLVVASCWCQFLGCCPLTDLTSWFLRHLSSPFCVLHSFRPKHQCSFCFLVAF